MKASVAVVATFSVALVGFSLNSFAFSLGGQSSSSSSATTKGLRKCATFGTHPVTTTDSKGKKTTSTRRYCMKYNTISEGSFKTKKTTVIKPKAKAPETKTTTTTTKKGWFHSSSSN